MWKAAFVGAVALVTLGSLSIRHDGIGVTQAAAQEVVVTDANIARLKSALRLSPAQEVHWRSLESVLRRSGQRAQTGEGGLFQRVKARVRAYVLDAVAARQVAVAAQPLIASLDDQQKQEGMTVIRAMGVSALF